MYILCNYILLNISLLNNIKNILIILIIDAFYIIHLIYKIIFTIYLLPSILQNLQKYGKRKMCSR